MKISFDFDSCLSTERIQKIASKFILDGHDVWVTTSRFTNEKGLENKWPWTVDQNNLLFEITDKLGIPREKIQFTNMESKHLFLDGFDIHFDDNETEIEFIEENIKCLGILINTSRNLTIHE